MSTAWIDTALKPHKKRPPDPPEYTHTYKSISEDLFLPLQGRSSLLTKLKNKGLVKKICQLWYPPDYFFENEWVIEGKIEFTTTIKFSDTGRDELLKLVADDLKLQ